MRISNYVQIFIIVYYVMMFIVNRAKLQQLKQICMSSIAIMIYLLINSGSVFATLEMPNYARDMRSYDPSWTTVKPDLNFYPKNLGGRPNGGINSLVVQPDGKIIAGGTIGAANGGYFTPNLVRYNIDGSMDASFVVPIVSNPSGRIELQSDGKLIVPYRGNVSRYNIDGSVDPTFSTGTLSGGSGVFLGIQTVAVLPNGKILIGGRMGGSFGGNYHCGLMQLNSNGTLDTTFVISFDTCNVRSIAVQQDGKILIGGAFNQVNGIPYNRLARLNTDGTVDTTFQNPALNEVVHAVRVLPSGNIVIGGNFTRAQGIIRNFLAVLLPNGQVDTTFQYSNQIAAGQVEVIAVQPDGKIVIGGGFTSFGGIPQNRIARLNSNGTFDTSFVIGSGLNNRAGAGNGAARDGTIRIAPNGNVIVGGEFTQYQGVSSMYLASIRPNGDINTSFVLQGGTFNGRVTKVVVDSKSRTIIGGDFANFGTSPGVVHSRLTRLLSNGSSDASFVVSGITLNNTIFEIVEARDGKYYIGGLFSQGITRLLENGTRDIAFSIGLGFNNQVLAIAEAADGKIYVGGSFTSYSGVVTNKIARLNQNGTLDTTFNIGVGFSEARSNVRDIVVQPDGKILVAGSFGQFNGQSVRHLIRITQNGTLDTTFQGSNNTPSSQSTVMKILLEDDGKIVIGGSAPAAPPGSLFINRLLPNGTLDRTFTTLPHMAGGQWVQDIIKTPENDYIIIGGLITPNGCCAHTAEGMFRLKYDGSYDYTFDSGKGFKLNPVGFTPWAGGQPTTAALHPNGRLLVGGIHTSYDGDNMPYFAALILPETWEREGYETVEISSLGGDTTNGMILGRAHTILASDISDDARYVAFITASNNFSQIDNNAFNDVYVRDRTTNVTKLVSVGMNGTGSNGNSTFVRISGNGRYVAFASDASNLVAGDTNGSRDVFVYDMQTEVITRVSISTANAQGVGGTINPQSGTLDISDDGRYVVFAIPFTNLSPVDTNSVNDVYVRDISLGTTTLVSSTSTSIVGNGESYLPMLAGSSGVLIAFITTSTNMGAGNAGPDVVLKNMSNSQVTNVSVGHIGQQSNAVSSFSIAKDGTRIAFASTSPMISGELNNGISDVFVRNLITSTTVAISVTSGGVFGNQASTNPYIDSQGNGVFFTSNATNLTTGDTNGVSDIYRKDIESREVQRVSLTYLKRQPNNSIAISNISSNGQYILGLTRASNMIYWDSNTRDDLYLFVSPEFGDDLLTYTDPAKTFLFKYPKTFGYRNITGRGSLVTILTPLTQSSRLDMGSAMFFVTKGRTTDTTESLYQRTNTQMRKLFRNNLVIKSEIVRSAQGNTVRVVKYTGRIGTVTKEYTVAVLRDATSVYTITAHADANRITAINNLVDTAIRTWQFTP